jgi:quercetin dioxygenase-like cupin family protein
VGFLRPGSRPAIEIALEAGTSQEGQPITLEAHGGDEFGIVLDGRYELLTIGPRQVLDEGDSIRISGLVAHQIRPIGDRPSRILWVVSPPDQEAEAGPQPSPRRRSELA